MALLWLMLLLIHGFAIIHAASCSWLYCYPWCLMFIALLFIAGALPAVQAQRLEEEAARAVLFSCQVVACTCIGAGDPRLQ
eukprot:scaffold82231_cov14-Tisochrysis_lutea.AAC.1